MDKSIIMLNLDWLRMSLSEREIVPARRGFMLKVETRPKRRNARRTPFPDLDIYNNTKRSSSGRSGHDLWGVLYVFSCLAVPFLFQGFLDGLLPLLCCLLIGDEDLWDVNWLVVACFPAFSDHHVAVHDEDQFCYEKEAQSEDQRREVGNVWHFGCCFCRCQLAILWGSDSLVFEWPNILKGKVKVGHVACFGLSGNF